MNDAENKPGPAKKMGLNMFGKSCSLSRGPESDLWGSIQVFWGGTNCTFGAWKVCMYVYI